MVGIRKIIHEKKSTEYTLEMILDCCRFCYIPLCHIINLSFSSWIFPNSLKVSKSILDKIFEKIRHTPTEITSISLNTKEFRPKRTFPKCGTRHRGTVALRHCGIVLWCCVALCCVVALRHHLFLVGAVLVNSYSFSSFAQHLNSKHGQF